MVRSLYQADPLSYIHSLQHHFGLPLESIAVLIGIDWFAGMFRTLMNVDVDVLIGLLVASKLGELDRDVYDEKKTVTY